MMPAYIFDPTNHQRDPSGKFADIVGKGDDAPKTPSDEAVLAYMDRMAALPTIDLNNRPVVKNEDGSISTVNSMTVEFDDGYFVLPTVIGDKVHDEDFAVAYFRKTGEHLGAFQDMETANEYAEALHLAQEKQYPNPADQPENPKEPAKLSKDKLNLAPSDPVKMPVKTSVTRKGSKPVKRIAKPTEVKTKAKSVMSALRNHKISRKQALARLVKLGYSEQEAEKELQVALSESTERKKLTRTQRLIQSWNDYP